MMMFDDKVGGWGWLNDDVIKRYTRKTIYPFEDITDQFNSSDFFSGKMNQNYYAACRFFFNKNKPCLILALFIKERKKILIGGGV